VNRPQLFLFFVAVGCMAAAMGVHDSIFNNYLSDTFSLSAQARGWLELPRETPGFLVFLTLGLLATLPLTRVGVVGTLVFGAGMMGLGLFGSHYVLMMAFMCIGSAGMHILQPVGNTVAIALSTEKNRGWRLGQMGSVSTFGMVAGTGFVWWIFDKTAPQYRTLFFCGAGLACIAALTFASMNIPDLRKPRARLVFRMKYRLYYLLELFFGARKQIFITFGPWVLIQVYDAPASVIAGLLMTSALIGIVVKPIVGLLIDWFGERAVLVADGLILAVVCIGYGYALRIMPDPVHARMLAYGCFIADNLLFSLGSARAVYLSRHTDNAQELTSTLAMGVSINHIVSMTIPIAAGAVWSGYGYERVFLGAALLAVFIAVLSSRVPGKGA